MTNVPPDISIPIGFSPDAGAPLHVDAGSQRLHSLTLTLNDDDRVRMQCVMLAGRIANRLDGHTDESVTVVDPSGDLTAFLLDALSGESVRSVRWLDYGEADGAPRLNLLSPEAFPDRDACVDSLVAGVRGLLSTWGNRLEDTLRMFLELGYEYNRVASATDGERLSVADALRLPVSFDEAGVGRAQSRVPYGDLARALRDCGDAGVCRAAGRYLSYPSDTQAELFGVISHQVGRVLRGCRDGESVLECRETVPGHLPSIVDGGVTVVSAGSGRMGPGAANILSNWLVGLFEHTIRSQDSRSEAARSHLLACDQFVGVRGASWPHLLAQARKYRGVLCLSDSSLPGNDRTAAGYLANCASLLAGRLNQIDAGRVALEMPNTAVTDFTAMQPREFMLRLITPRHVNPPCRLVMVPPR